MVGEADMSRRGSAVGSPSPSPSALKAALDQPPFVGGAYRSAVKIVSGPKLSYEKDRYCFEFSAIVESMAYIIYAHAKMCSGGRGNRF